MLRPLNFHLVVDSGLRDAEQRVVRPVIAVGHLVADTARFGLLDPVDLEWVLGASFWLHVRQEHLVVIGPILGVLLELNEGSDFWVAPWEVLPPVLRFFSLRVEGQFLSMDADCLLAEFLGILIYHLLTALLFDITEGLGLAFLLLHSKEAHLTLVEPLLSVLD